MFYDNISPVIAHIGSLQIRYYGVFFAVSIVLAYFLVKHLAKHKGLKLKQGDVEELLIYVVIGIILGARLFHVFVYNFSYYAARPLEIFAIWNGGLAFHGGVIGAIVAGYLFSRKKKLNFLDLADIATVPAALGLGLGRVANFINGELYGKITMVPWAVKFQGVEGFRHPVQLYEALKNFFIFGFLFFLENKTLPSGFLFWLFMAMYGGMRFVLEFYKQVQAAVFGLSLGQIFSIVMLVTGVVMLLKMKSLNNKKKANNK